MKNKSEPVLNPRSSKINYWMVTTIVLITLYIITGAYIGYKNKGLNLPETVNMSKKDTVVDSDKLQVVTHFIGDLVFKHPVNDFFLETDPLQTKKGETKTLESFALVPSVLIKARELGEEMFDGSLKDEKIYIEVLLLGSSKIAIYKEIDMGKISDFGVGYVKFVNLDDLANKFYSRFIFDDNRKLKVTSLTKMDNPIGRSEAAYTFDDNSQNLELSEIGPVLFNNAIPGRRYYVIEHLGKYYIISYPLDQTGLGETIEDLIVHMYFDK